MYLEGYDNMTITWDLTPTEEKALQKYVKVSSRQDSQSKSEQLQPTTLKNLGVEINGSVLPSESNHHKRTKQQTDKKPT